jgi:hypothetical protein
VPSFPLRWTKDRASLTWDGASLTLSTTTPVTTLTVEARSSREDPRFECAAIRAVGVELVAEVQAAIREGDALRRVDPPRDRPSRPRIFGFGGRGSSTPGAWILGRIVRLSARRGDLPFEELLANGLPEDHGLSDEVAAALIEAVRALAPLACPCGSGAETFDQHGALERLSGPVQHPDAPVTHQASAGRCRLCGGCWILLESGDSHYDFRYTVSAPQGPDASA